jgi:hypothetical protein
VAASETTLVLVFLPPPPSIISASQFTCCDALVLGIYMQVKLRRTHLLCHSCLEISLLSRVRAGLRSKGGVEPDDAVAAAYSGGPSSTTLVRYLSLIKCQRTDQRDKGRVPFKLVIIHIHDDISDVSPQPPRDGTAPNGREADVAASDDSARHSEYGKNTPRILDQIKYLTDGDEGVDVCLAPLSDVFSSDEPDLASRQRRLRSLLSAVRDATSKKDVRVYLRTRLLCTLASARNCRFLALGQTSDGLAAEAVAAAAKGRGYALPGDVACRDARLAPGGPIVLHPLREVSAEEMEAVCSRLGAEAGLRRDDEEEFDGADINDLASNFTASILKQNPGAVSNIMSVIGKLEAFAWNGLGFEGGGQTESGNDRAGGEVLCPLCFAPLADDELEICVAAARGAKGAKGLPWCDSCRHGVLGCSEESAAEIVSLLPADICRHAERLKSSLLSLGPESSNMYGGDLRAAYRLGVPGGCQLDSKPA